MMIKTKAILALTIAILFVVSCAPRKTIDSSANVEQQAVMQEEFHPVPSYISVPIEIKTSYLEHTINSQLKDCLYQNDSMVLGAIKNVKCRVWKKDSVSISVQGDKISYRIPLKIWMKVGFTLWNMGLNLTESQDIEASIALKFTTKFSINNDWSLSTVTTSDGYEWLTDPVIHILKLSIPVKPVADIVLEKQGARFGAIVDKAISQNLDMKKLLKPIWHKIQTPMLVSDSMHLWLRLSPKAVFMSQLRGDNGTALKGLFGIKTLAETFFNEEPMVVYNDSIPNLFLPGNIDTGFTINLYNEVTYTYAEQMARIMLEGRSFKMGKNEIIVKGLNFYMQEGYVVVSLNLLGAFNGTVYVLGKPYMDQVTQVLSIKDLEFNLSTKNKVYKNASWLFHDFILSKVQPALRFPIKEMIEKSKESIDQALYNRQVSKGVYINGKMDAIELRGVTLTDKAIRVAVLGRGKLSVNLEKK